MKFSNAITRRDVMKAASMATIASVAIPVSAPAASAAEPELTNIGKRFSGKVILITGATSGIGEAAARAFAAEGGKVFFCGRRENLGAAVEASIRKTGGEATYLRADVRREEDVKSLVNACIAKYGGLNVAFNNAGVDKPPASIADLSISEFDDQLATNLRGVFLSMKYELPHLVKARGALINMGSIGGRHAFPNIIGYAASKAGVIHMTRCCAQEYGRDVRANVVAPGAIATDMLARVQKEWNVSAEQLASSYPIKRLGTAEETAEVVLWLASPAASYVSGQIIGIDGGDLA